MTVTVITRMPSVDHDATMDSPVCSQSLSATPSLSPSTLAFKSQHTSRVSMSEGVSLGTTVRSSGSSSKTGVFPGSPVTLGATL